MSARKTALLFASLLLLLPSAHAQTHDSRGTDTAIDSFQEDRTSIQERKSPGWFGKPKTASAKEEMALAAKYRETGKLGKAARRFLSIVRYWGSAPEAALAQKSYADLLLDMGSMEDAFDEYQYLIRFYAGQFNYDEVLDNQLKIANYMMTEPRRVLFIFRFEAPERAIPYFEKILENGPTWRKADEVQYNIGLIREEAGDLDEAILAYDAVMSRFGDSSLAPDAEFRKAACLLQLYMKSPRDERSLREALAAMVRFAVNNKSHERYDEAVDHVAAMKAALAKMYFDRAEFYEKVNKNDKAAIIAYTEFIKEFPLSERADDARARIDKLKERQGAEE